MKKLTTEEFIEKAIAVHGDRYDYSLVDYKTIKTPIKIICKIHGIFEQIPNNHTNGLNCDKCGIESSIKVRRLSLEKFIEKATLVHGDRYDYSLVDYKNAKIHVKIICKEHGIFLQAPEKHTDGNGCSECMHCGFMQNKSAIVYYLKLESSCEIIYKIGITNRTMKERLTSMGVDKSYNVIIIQETYYERGIDAYNEEQRLHKLHKEFKYLGEAIMKNGNTELFIKDVLELDNL